jgi:hypothetical protein
MLEGFPISLDAGTVGKLALALPFVALIVINIVKGWFYWWKRIPDKWKAALPDKYVWPGLAGVICIAGCFIFRINIAEALAGDDWPSWFPGWVDTLVSGVALAAFSSKVLYPLVIAPPQKQKAIAAVAAACGPPATPIPVVPDAPTEPAVPIPAPPSQPLEEPPVPPTPPAVLPVPTARLFLEVHQGGPDRFVLIEDGTGQHIYPCS